MPDRCVSTKWAPRFYSGRLVMSATGDDYCPFVDSTPVATHDQPVSGASAATRLPVVTDLVEASRSAQLRGDWASALAMAEAAFTLAPDDAEIATLVATARSGAAGSPSDSGTRRRVTVMFCDLVGSTELANSLDPEDTREILAAYHQTCGAIVRQYDGHVAHLMGDGLLVYFGYPRAHEDDGLRSVMAAMAMSDATSALRSPSSGAALGLRVRVGIHTGLAVISEIASGAWSRPGDIFGSTPNIASRVQAAARPGTIVISADTLRIVHEHVEVEALGPHALKGIEEPIELFCVASLRVARDDQVGGAAIGRDDEIALLEQTWQQIGETPGYVVITGEPGIGKSHLYRHLRGVVNGSGGRTVTLQCSALNSATPLAPVVQLFSELLHGVSDPHERLALLTQVARSADVVDDEQLSLLARLAGVPWPDDRPVPMLQPETARERTLLALLSWLEGLAAEKPLLVAVEDLQWADPSTVDVLVRFLANPGLHPSMVVVTTRLDAGTAPGSPTSVLRLGPLDAASCDELIDVLTVGRFDDDTRALVAQRGEGVPLYVRELARMVQTPDGDTRAGGSVSMVAIPPTLNDLLVARLDAFPQERAVVEALAVLGRPTPVSVLAEMVGATADRAQRQLDVLQRAGIVRFVASPPTYDFHHGLLRDVAYEGQLLARRRDLHGRSAAVLAEAFRAANEAQPHVLAHHHEMAGSLDDAAKQWMLAGTHQAGLAAHVEAILAFENVLRLLERLGSDDDNLELAARMGLAASLLSARGYFAHEVADAYATVRALSASRDSRVEITGLYGLWAYYHVTGDAVASLEAAQAMVERSAHTHDQLAELASMAVLGYQLVRLGRPAEAVEMLERSRAWDSPEPLFPHHAGIGAAANLAMAQWLVGRFGEARNTIDAAVAGAEAATDATAHFTRAYTHAFAAELFQIAGRPDVAAQHAGRTVQISADFGFTSWLGAGMTNLKVSEALLADPNEAIPTIEYCLAAWRSSGAAANLTQFGLGLALAVHRAGRTEAALAVIDAAIVDAAASDERFVEPELHRVRGELLAALDPSNALATEAFEWAVQLAAGQRSTALQLRALTSLERHLRTTDAGRSVASQIDALLAALDPAGDDPEPVLVDARSLHARGGA